MRGHGRANFWWAVGLAWIAGCAVPETTPARVRGEVVLPAPSPAGSALLDDVIAARRSTRAFTGETLTNEEMGRLYWAGQGITDSHSHRAVPSAGALYPLELYGVTAEGVTHYVPEGHKLELMDVGDVRSELSGSALDQEVVMEAPLVLVVVGVVARTRGKYGDRAERFVALEAGHAAQNVLLEATALGLGGVTIGTFEDEEVRTLLRLPSGSFPYYLLCVGRPLGR